MFNSIKSRIAQKAALIITVNTTNTLMLSPTSQKIKLERKQQNKTKNNMEVIIGAEQCLRPKQTHLGRWTCCKSNTPLPIHRPGSSHNWGNRALCERMNGQIMHIVADWWLFGPLFGAHWPLHWREPVFNAPRKERLVSTANVTFHKLLKKSCLHRAAWLSPQEGPGVCGHYKQVRRIN